MSGKDNTEALGRVVHRLWEFSQKANSQSEREDFTLALAICRLARGYRHSTTDAPASESIVESAYITSFGTNRKRFLRARSDREWKWATALKVWEHEAMEQTRSVRGPAAREGVVLPMPAKKKPTQSEPVRAMSQKG